MCKVKSLTREKLGNGNWLIKGEGSADCPKGSKVFLDNTIANSAPEEVATVDNQQNFSFSDQFPTNSLFSQGPLKIIVKKPDGTECCSKKITPAKPQPEPKRPCFIATAAYGTKYAPDVLTLTQFRDNILLMSKLGRLFTNFYYTVSPPIARLVERSPFLQKSVRIGIIRPLAKLCRNFDNHTRL